MSFNTSASHARLAHCRQTGRASPRRLYVTGSRGTAELFRARPLRYCRGMKLARLAAIAFSKVPRRNFVPGVLSGHDVDVELTAAGDMPQVGKHVVIAKAYISLPSIEPTPAGLLIVPPEPRKHAEAAIERAADLLAVTSRTSRQIFSGRPSIALIPEHADDELILGAA
jgi:hypothetical protein